MPSQFDPTYAAIEAIADSHERAYALLHLRLSGVTGATVNRLIRLKRAWTGRSPTLDGYEPDARAEFAHWLYASGRIGS